MRFHQKAPKRAFLIRREADVLLGAIEKVASKGLVDATEDQAAGSSIGGAVRTARRRAAKKALAARDHAAFSCMIYAGLRIEEATALMLEDLSFARGAEEVRVARGKGNKERLVPMGPRLKRSLRRYLERRPPPPLHYGERAAHNRGHFAAPALPVGQGEPPQESRLKAP